MQGLWPLLSESLTRLLAAVWGLLYIENLTAVWLAAGGTVCGNGVLPGGAMWFCRSRASPDFFFFTVLSYFTVCFLFFHRVHGRIKIFLNKKIYKTLNFTVKIPRKKVGGADAKQTGRKGCGSVGHGNCGGRGSGGCGRKGIRPQPDVA